MVSEQILGPWGYIADVIQKYFGWELTSTIMGGNTNQRLGLHDLPCNFSFTLAMASKSSITTNTGHATQANILLDGLKMPHLS